MKIVYRILFVINIVVMSISTAIMIPLNCKEFYDYEFEKQEVLKNIDISKEDLDLLRDNIILYFDGTEDTLQTQVEIDGNLVNFYTEDELLHMEDVKVIFLTIRYTAITSFCLFVLTLLIELFLFKDKKKYKHYGNVLLSTSGFLLSVLIAIGTYILVDWDGAFTLMHSILFSQGNWLFPSNSNMLSILPEGLFMDAGYLIIFVFLFALIVMLISGIICKVKYKRIAKKDSNIII